MEPITLTWPGSTDVVTIRRSDNSTYDARDEIAEFLSSRYRAFWPMEPDPERPGEMMSIDQRNKWRAVLADVYYVNGPVLVARHTAGSNRVIAVAIARPTQFAHEAELLIQSTGGYASEDLDPRMRAELVAECQRAGMVLGRAEMVRRWVSL